VSPPESVHALDLERLRRPDIQFWTGWWADAGSPERQASLVATAALQRLDASHMELKSMRTSAAVRRQGVAEVMLGHVLRQARGDGVQRLSLETGSQAFFAPARVLYLKHGFKECPPFAAYASDPHSCFMTRAL
jgi:putative acetyltransferase